MNRIRFEQRKRKKIHLLPLLSVLSLYFIIPLVLISRGSKIIDNAMEKMNSVDVISPPIEYYNGLAFLTAAASIPGFGKFAENVSKKSFDQMIKMQDAKFKLACFNLIKKPKGINILNSYSIHLNLIANEKSSSISISINQSNTVFESNIVLTDSVLQLFDSIYCTPWNNFYNKVNIDKANLHPFCKTNY